MPVAFEKSGQLLLELGRECSGAVLRRELGGRPRAQRIARRRILTRGPRDLPEPEVHLGRGVVGKTAKDSLQVARSCAAAEHAARERVAQHAGDHDADQAGKEPRREGEDELLVRVEPLGRRFRDRDTRNSSIELGQHSLSRGVRSQHRAHRALRRTGAESRGEGQQAGARRRSARSQTRVVEKLREDRLASKLHNAHDARR